MSAVAGKKRLRVEGGESKFEVNKRRSDTPGEYLRYRDLIGGTPIVDLTSLASPKVSGIKILGKCEFLNPGFSIKDRIVRNIFDAAEKRGELKPGMTVVAASSGNTGASVAMLGAMRGYHTVIITNSKCSQEKCDSIRCYGAELRVVKDGVCYMAEETRLAKENPTWFSVNQYDNQDNTEAHHASTGPEIWDDTNGQVTHFVAAGSTGGTVSGVGRFLKGQRKDIQVVLADPHGSIFANYHQRGVVDKPGKFLVEGVGKNTIPEAMHFDVIDSVVRVHDADAFRMCKAMAAKEGIFAGGSSGLNVHAAVELANKMDKPATIVTILCDLGVKYLSKVYNEAWLDEHGMLGSGAAASMKRKA